MECTNPLELRIKDVLGVESYVWIPKVTNFTKNFMNKDFEIKSFGSWELPTVVSFAPRGRVPSYLG